MPKARLMGILNVTPDSFFAESRCMHLPSATDRAIQMYQAGADVIDIGGESTRPNAQPVEVEEEINRVLPVIKALRQILPIPLSIDTYKPEVAAAAIEAGATLLNDIQGFTDPAMRALAAASGADICVMHMQGTPTTMQQNPHYSEGIIRHLVAWFEERVNSLLKAGVKEQQIILDPGIGFGKTIADNLEIIENLAVFKAMGFPVLMGVSRKSFMAKILNKTTADLLPATLAVNTTLLLAGADYLRVHDVGEHRDLINLLDRMKNKNA